MLKELLGALTTIHIAAEDSLTRFSQYISDYLAWTTDSIGFG